VPPRSVLYFHGFASSPRSQKVDSLAALLAPDLVLNAPDLNVPSFDRLDFEAMVRLGVDSGRTVPPHVIVGSSLGALLALEVVRRGIVAPLVLIAPALGVGEHWLKTIPDGDPVLVFNHLLNAKAPIHRAFFEQMKGVRPERSAPATQVTVVMGEKDETIPFALVRDVWEGWERSGQLVPGSAFIEIPGGDHSLVAHVDVIAREIRKAALTRPPATLSR
jgi:pimeloyl-ACP methyl ester carboxylesterase